jgi:septal ring factor EnvC (AmiA/AmiB activator)
VQLHPYILNLLSEDRIAQMHAQAASDREARNAARRRKAAKRQASRDRVSGHRAPRQPAWSSHRPVGHASRQDDSQLVSVGRAGTDDRL